MKISFHSQHPDGGRDKTLRYIISNLLDQNTRYEASVAVAYMTVSGLKLFLDCIPSGGLQKSKWLVGLDDYITQPGALDVLFALNNAEVRVVSYGGKGSRFHPKIFWFGNINSTQKGTVILGSANLTLNALSKNCEAVAIAKTNNLAGSGQIKGLWDELWRLGHAPDADEVEKYRREYFKYKNNIINAQAPKNAAILESDIAEIDPSLARTCWIECGNITALGRELEFKAEQGMFFGLNPRGEASREFGFKASSGKVVSLRMKFQGNHMWRLQLNNNIPEVRRGLRPTRPDGRLGRSPYVAVFGRTEEPDIFNIKFILRDSPRFTAILNKSTRMGTVGKTSARQYGWH